ncbi:G-protein coupled receptor moody [Holothuria leucospilota]|uniref:G-protein coupled receptor moody n=1 Tax=Holothuria leucospilota TaxID=206669 RepID=A0A9Q0YMF6_HOLLE|nr:G-protein coupled receptor moody [Holothuria leucospilota]
METNALDDQAKNLLLEDKVPDKTHRIIVGLVLFLASIVGLVGNALVILAVIASKKLRTSTNAFVVNLAVADFLASTFLPFLSLSLLLDGDPPIPHWLCGIAITYLYLCLACSVYTLASIAVNRLFLITKPVNVYRRLFQLKVLVVWITCIWVIALAMVVLPMAFGIGILAYDKSFHICGGVPSHNLSEVYDEILVLGIYPLPLLVIVVSYTRLYIHIRLHNRRMMDRGDPNEIPSNVMTKNAVDTTTPLPYDVPTSSTSQANSRMKPYSSVLTLEPLDSYNVTPNATPQPIRRELATTCETHTPSLSQMRDSARKEISKKQVQITKNLFYVVCAFLLCGTPCVILSHFDLKNVGIYAISFIFLNSCINPFIYATKHPHFKEVIKCILLCQLKNVPEPGDFLKPVVNK